MKKLIIMLLLTTAIGAFAQSTMTITAKGDAIPLFSQEELRAWKLEAMRQEIRRAKEAKEAQARQQAEIARWQAEQRAKKEQDAQRRAEQANKQQAAAAAFDALMNPAPSFNPDDYSTSDLSSLRITYMFDKPGSAGRKLIVALEKRKAAEHAAETPMRIERELHEINRTLDAMDR